MSSNILWPYLHPSIHEATAEIIKRRSTNQDDIREVVLGDLDLSFARRVLDLGCGFGFMSEAVARRVSPDATVLGVDEFASNREPFLSRVAATGRRAEFMEMSIGTHLPWEDRSFDVVVSSYSLYFFLPVLPEICRVLASPDGIFICITHSVSCCRDILHAAGIAEEDSPLPGILSRFSKENGADVLGPYFADVRRIDYENQLVFQRHHEQELVSYLKFKLPLLVEVESPDQELPHSLLASVRDAFEGKGHVVVDKDDAGFVCRRPTC